eukprot:9472668-Heterocapsa_arctica.AAC.1
MTPSPTSFHPQMPLPQNPLRPSTTLTSQDHSTHPGTAHSTPGKEKEDWTGWKYWGYRSWEDQDLTEEPTTRA